MFLRWFVHGYLNRSGWKRSEMAEKVADAGVSHAALHMDGWGTDFEMAGTPYGEAEWTRQPGFT